MSNNVKQPFLGTEQPTFNKEEIYIEVFSNPDKNNECEFMYWRWKNSINTNFIDTWLGQAYYANLDNFIKNYKGNYTVNIIEKIRINGRYLPVLPKVTVYK